MGMGFEHGQDTGSTRSGAATLAGNGNGVDAAARDLLFIEQLKFGQVELADESVFLCGLLHDSVDSARHEALRRNVEIEVTRCDRVVSSRRGDRRRLIQAFDQLIRNAIQYSPKGGTVEVRGTLLDRRFAIEVEDQGPGISAEEENLVCDAFFRGTAAVEQGITGRGIGLTVARAIIEAHGGWLRVGANGDRGATAFVELPH
jgi:signal transduction histidine kinase